MTPAGQRTLARQLIEGARMGTAFAVKPHNSYQHEAFLYRDPQEFLAGTVGFILDAVRLGQPVMVALPKPRLHLLQQALESEGQVAGPGERLLFVDMAALGSNPARIIPAWHDFVAAFGGKGKPVRGIGEPQWPGRPPEEAVECQLHEALMNMAVHPDVPLWLRCPYDVSGLPGPLVEAALHSHPALLEGEDYRGSTRYGGLHHVDAVFRSALPPAPSGSARLVFSGVDLVAVRTHVTRFGADAGLDPDRLLALTLAVAEVAANSVRYGGGEGELLTWVQPGALVCEITDQGRHGGPMVGRRAPTLTQERGRGLWVANQVSDLVQIRSTPNGTATRVFAWL